VKVEEVIPLMPSRRK